MSVLIGLKLNDMVVLASDSRLYDASATRFISDAGLKIRAIAPGLCFGWAGFSQIAQIQAAMGARLASEGITDIRELADRLDEACTAAVRQTLEAAAPMRQQAPLHSYVLGDSSGFIGRGFQLHGGKVHMSETDGLHSPFALFGAAATPADTDLIVKLAHIPGWWTDGVKGLELIIEALRCTNPLIGGPIQMVAIDRSGARWIHRPAVEEVAIPASGTVTALVSMISPVISGGVIVGATLTLNLNGTTVTIDNAYDTRLLGYPGLKVANNAYPDRRICIVDDGIWGIDQNNTVRFQLFTDGTLHLFDAGGTERVLLDGLNGQVIVTGLGVKVNGTFITVP